MITHDLIQGSPEWLAHRAQHFNASDAPAMMGCSSYKTRSELLRELHTGVAPDVDDGAQRRFDEGHRFEALARPLAEKIIGYDLFPVTGSEGRYSASFDGLTMMEDVIYEHKRLNAQLRAAIRQQGGNANDFLAPMYRVQLEQQCMVSGAQRALFMASEWDADGNLIEERHCWYTPDHELRAQIIDGWAQFETDLCAYVPPVIAEPARAETMESLPAVAVRLDGALTVAGNLPSFAKALRAFIDRMPKQPATDNDFATTDAACKALKKAEEALDAAESGALASITDVEAMRRAVADCRKLARDTRLAAEKLVERRKVEIKEQAVRAAGLALLDHVATLNGELAPMRLQPVPADFAGSIKGLRSIASMQDALDTTLANAKIAADGQARVIRANVATFKAKATGLEFLFADLGQLVHKAADDFAAVVDQRITKHRADEAAKEAKRQADEAERIAKATAAAAEKARRDEEARQQELQRQQAEAQAKAAAPAPAPTAPLSVAEPAQPAQAMLTHAAPQVVRQAQAPAANEPATMSLGAINALLDADGGLVLRGEFVTRVLQVLPAGRSPKATALWRESQFPQIVTALHNHLSRVLAQQDQKAA